MKTRSSEENDSVSAVTFWTIIIIFCNNNISAACLLMFISECKLGLFA